MISLFNYIGELEEYIDDNKFLDQNNNSVLDANKLLQFMISTLKGDYEDE